MYIIKQKYRLQNVNKKFKTKFFPLNLDQSLKDTKFFEQYLFTKVFTPNLSH